MNKHFTERCKANVKNFANAREVRNLFEYALSRQANRVVLINNPTQNDLTLLTLSDVSGENLNVGKQQFMAKLVMDDMTRERRYGIKKEDWDILVDEFEFSAGSEEILRKNKIESVGDILDFLDKHKSFDKLKDINEESKQEIVKGLESIGFVM